MNRKVHVRFWRQVGEGDLPRLASKVESQRDGRGKTTSYNYADGTGALVTHPATSYEPGYHPTVQDIYEAQAVSGRTLYRLVTRLSAPSTNSAENVGEHFGYDANFNLTLVTDGENHTTNLCYDVQYSGASTGSTRGNLTRLIGPPPQTGQSRPVTLYRYDARDNLIQEVASKGVPSGSTAGCTEDFSGFSALYATDYGFDGSGTNLETITQRFTDPDLGQQTAVTRYQYTDTNNPGRVTKITSPRGNTGGDPAPYTTTMAHYGPGSGRTGMPYSTTDPVGNIITYDYDAVGRRTSTVDPNGNASGGVPSQHTWYYEYDKEDRLRFEKTPPASGLPQLVTENRYDPVGNRTAVIDTKGQVTKYTYDQMSNLIEVHESDQEWKIPDATPTPGTEVVTEHQYDDAGYLKRTTRAKDSADARATDYAFDGLGRVRLEIQYLTYPPTEDPLSKLVTSYSYDKNGNLTTLTDPQQRIITSTYDGLDRLASVAYSDGQTPGVNYGYDAGGNRVSMIDGAGSSATYDYDELDRLKLINAGTATHYRYDLDGNRRQLKYPDARVVDYLFDGAGQLKSHTDWGNRTVRYQYYPDGNLKLVERLVDVANPTNVVTETTYTYDNALRLTQVWNKKKSDGSTISKHTYTVDPVGNRTQGDEVVRLAHSGPVSVWTWGLNSSGQLGDGTTTNRALPAQGGGMIDVTAVSSGLSHTLALGSDGTVWAWGSNGSGELGDGTQTSSSIPVHVRAPSGSGYLDGIVAISAGGHHSLALRNDGTVWAWGYNYNGQLGNGTQSTRFSPVQVSDLTGVAAVSAGFSHSLAVKSDGTVWAWGSNYDGELGDRSTRDASAPVQTRNLTGVTSIAAGDHYSLAVKSDGSAWSWGSNYYGELGNGTTRSANTPVQVKGPGGVGTLGGVQAITTNYSSASTALKNDGTVWTWGYNYRGQLGDGTTTDRTTPVQVVGPAGTGVLSDVSGIASGRAVTSDGRVFAWGDNSYGQLGLGGADTNNHPVPEQLTGISAASFVATRGAHTVALAPQKEQQSVVTYDYDRLDRLEAVTRAGASPVTYQYDRAGNRKFKNDRYYAYDQSDHIESVGGILYTTDDHGNVVQRGSSDVFAYDQANRLKNATVGGTTVGFTYDGDGKRLTKVVGSTTHSYFYDVNRDLPVVLEDSFRRNVWGHDLAYAIDIRLLSGASMQAGRAAGPAAPEALATEPGDVLVYHKDGLGSVRAITDVAGNVIETYETDEFGVVTSAAGTVEQPFGYTGEIRDVETGLVYLRARYYDPEVGRFVSRDTELGDPTHPLSYM